jgi:C-terminal processing protease CtpA/Prc
MMRKTSLILLGALAGVAATLILTQPRVLLAGSAARAAVSDTYRELNLFGDVFERVRADYVEKPDDSKLVESAINGMLAGLDPHSSYMDPKSFRDMQVQTRGEFGGLGIEVTMEDGLVKVVAPIDETPAAKAGVMANDIITGVRKTAMSATSASRNSTNRPPTVSSKRSPNSTRSSAPTRSKDMCSTCATIRAGCSIRRSRSLIPSWKRARSYRPAAAIRKRRNGSMRGLAT